MILYSINPGSNQPQVQQLKSQKSVKKYNLSRIYFLPCTTRGTPSEICFSSSVVLSCVLQHLFICCNLDSGKWLCTSISFWEDRFHGHGEETRILVTTASEHQKRNQYQNTTFRPIHDFQILQISSKPAVTAGTVMWIQVFGPVGTSKSTFYMPRSCRALQKLSVT